jgi:prophage maintenance system killer protein
MGVVAALVFLALNGFEIDADEETFERLVRGVAEGKADKGAVAAFLRQHACGSGQWPHAARGRDKPLPCDP